MLVPMFAFAALFVQPVQDSHLEVHLQHVKPAHFMRVEWRKLESDLLPKGFDEKCKVSMDNDRNLLILDGPKPELEQAKDVISFFDVSPTKIRLSLTVSNPAEGDSFASDATVDSTTAWHTESDALGISLTLTPRINDDGTISVLVAEKLLSGKDNGALTGARLRKGQKLDLYIPMKAVSQNPKGSSKEDSELQLQIKAEVG